ncbi:glutathione synthase [Lyngbya confervoides]|uniref:Glutathione synthetase n=1 Tax=Lyngbya confervoides BDU141951 TaxID=1574623 RepID=A0ABD4T1F2_9CYAN|nr:glutathione synthase [Lyngbya confervoides]MCM1982471.1 glutathione synthase [Lyngbya confervoides BDU141951]
MKLAFIIDPIEGLDPTHDTSVALMEAAGVMGDQVWITTLEHLSVIKGQTWATMQSISVPPAVLEGDRWLISQPWYTLGDPELLPLNFMDVVFMRKDPPVTVAYLYATYLLDSIDPKRTLVINAPAGIRAANEKMYALQFEAVIPRTIVSQEKATIRNFVESETAAVLKPLGGKAGEGILFLRPEDPNLNSMIEISTHQGRLPVMVQEYLPAAREGDKRIILLAGEPIGAVNRVPTGQEFRGNMATGGRVVATPITERDRFICDQVKASLIRDGLFFVGIDVIGDYLTEVNVTSPTGIREIDRLAGHASTSDQSLGRQVIAWLTQQCGTP